MAKKSTSNSGLDLGKAVDAISEVKSFVSSVSSFFEKKPKAADKEEHLKATATKVVVKDDDCPKETVKTTSETAEAINSSCKGEDKVTTIDSVDSLSGYLRELQTEASPSVMMALQSQLQMLKFVQSPTMTLMAIDNIMVCLHKALKNTANEEEKDSLREVFASLLQSFIFVSEARLKYEIDSNRDESVRLLSDAGDMLMSTVSTTALMVAAPVAGAAKGATSVRKALPVMNNVLASNTEQKSFLGRLISVKGKKAIVEEKKLEFDKTLNYIFETLDKYFELIGPSIQLHGILKRYADGLVERYSITQYALVAKQFNEKEPGKLDSILDSAEDVVKKKNIVGAARLLLEGVSLAVKSVSKHDYDSVMNMKRALQSELKNHECELVSIDESINQLNTELQGLSRLQFSRRGALQKQIDAHNARKSKIEKLILDCTKRITVVGDIIDPINERVEQYAANLNRIAQKYEYTL